MYRILFLDDRTKRIESARKKFIKHDLTVVSNVLECLRQLSERDFDAFYLDHDLGGRDFVDPDDKDSGMEIVRYIEKTGWPDKRKKPLICIHSSNVFAADLMELRLLKLGFGVVVRRWVYDT